MEEIASYLNDRINKIKPVFEYRHYDIYPGNDEDMLIIGRAIQHMSGTFVGKIWQYDDPEFCNRVGSVFKYLLNEVEKLENAKDKNSINYKCDWYKLNKLFYIFY